MEYFWKAGPPTNHSNNTGPSGDHTSGSGGYAFTEANTGFGGSSIFTNELISPLVDVSPLTTPEMTFWYHMYGTLINKLVVQVRTAGGSWTTLSTINGAQQSSSNDAWKEQIVDLTAYAGDTIQVKFIAHRYQGFNNQVDISLDDVDIHEKPNCPKPSNLVASNVTSNSVDLSWTTGGSTNWLVKYTPGSIVSAGTNPFTLTGLSPNTTYSIYVRDSCAAGDVSPWEGQLLLLHYVVWKQRLGQRISKGLDLTLQPVISMDVTPQVLRQRISGRPVQVQLQQTIRGLLLTTLQVLVSTGTLKQALVFNGDTEADMETMEIDLDTLSTPELSFWWHAAGGNIDEMEVEIYDGSTWTSELTINSTNNTLQSGPGDPWQEAVIDLSSYAGDTIKVRFTGSRASTFGFTSTQADWAIDDIEIDSTYMFETNGNRKYCQHDYLNHIELDDGWCE